MKKVVFGIVVFVILLIFVLALGVVARDVGVSVEGLLSPVGVPSVDSLKSTVERLEKGIASDNSSTENYESYLQKIEQNDTSAIRQQVYVEHMIHARLVNIDHTLEDTAKICYNGELQIARMLASVATMLRYILFSLVALGMLLVVSLLVFVARVVILG